MSNSTGAEPFKKAHPDRFFEMYIAEQNMAGAALGLAKRGKVPFVSTFAAFWTRAFDQIRMAGYSEGNIKFVGRTRASPSAQDGPSQMGLEDIAMFRTLLDSVVLHPCDAVSTEKLVEEMARHEGIALPADPAAGDAHPLRRRTRSSPSAAARCCGGATTTWPPLSPRESPVGEALAAYDRLAAEDIPVRVIDLYCVQPVDAAALRAAAAETRSSSQWRTTTPPEAWAKPC